METLFSTRGVHPRDRFDYWHSVACETLVDHDSVPENRATFSAELQYASFADIGVVTFENSPMAISHLARHVARLSVRELFICRQMAGMLALEQDCREVMLRPGDVTLIDPELPYSGRFFAGSKLLVVKVSRQQLESRIGTVRQMTGRCIRPGHAETAFLSSFLLGLQTNASEFGKAAQAIVSNQALDLIALALANFFEEGTPALSSARSLVAMKIRAAIEQRLADPMLQPATVAAAAGVSVRYANSVLAEQGTSIMRTVLHRRLERCRRALEDSSQRHRSVSEIAYGRGFSDMTHFARKFRGEYGMTPGDYRNNH